jgi:hypothetical protein
MEKPTLDRIEQFGGINSLYDLEKMPPIMQSKLVNMMASRKLGILQSRHELLNTGAAGNIFEFIKHNQTTHYYAQNTAAAIDIKSATRSGYGAVTWGNAVSKTDNRTAKLSTTVMAFPNRYREEVRSSQIRTSTGQYPDPMWAGYIDAQNRFDGGDSISAGFFLEDQFVQNKWSTFGATSCINSATPSYGTSYMGGIGGRPGYYYFFLAPVIDGYQKGIPEINASLVTRIPAALQGKFAPSTLIFGNTASYLYPRITDFDVFIGYAPERDYSNYTKGTVDSNVFTLPAYFLERISLNDQAYNYFLTMDATDGKGTITAPAANQIKITDVDQWLTFNPQFIKIYDATNNRTYAVSSWVVATGDITLTLDTTRYDNTTGATMPAKLQFFTDWYFDGANYKRKVFWDNKYMLRGSEMFEYLNLPPGEQGLVSHDHKFGKVCNQRYWMVGNMGGTVTSSTFSSKVYVSKYGEPDVMLSLSEINLEEEPTAVEEYGDDTILFFKNYFKIYRTNADGSIQELATDNRAGCSNKFGVTKVAKYELVGIDRKGPWMYKNGNLTRIGLAIQGMFTGDNENGMSQIDEQDVDGTFVEFYPGDNQVWFNIPSYSDSSETLLFDGGITLVYDRYMVDELRQGISPWYFFGFYNKSVGYMKPNYWGELNVVRGDTNLEIYNPKTLHSASGTENIISVVEFKTNRNLDPQDRKLYLGKIGVRYKADADADVAIGLYIDGASSPTSITADANTDFPNADIVIKRLADTFKLRISSDSDKSAAEDDFELKSVKITGKSKRKG